MTRNEENVLQALTPEELEAIRYNVLRLSSARQRGKENGTPDDARERIYRDMQLSTL